MRVSWSTQTYVWAFGVSVLSLSDWSPLHHHAPSWSIMLLPHAAPSWSLMLLHHAPLMLHHAAPSCSLMLLPHAPSWSLMLLHHAPLMLHHAAPSCCSLMVHHAPSWSLMLHHAAPIMLPHGPSCAIMLPHVLTVASLFPAILSQVIGSSPPAIVPNLCNYCSKQGKWTTIDDIPACTWTICIYSCISLNRPFCMLCVATFLILGIHLHTCTLTSNIAQLFRQNKVVKVL